MREYYGALNELKAGLKVEPERLEKPEALIEYEQVHAMGIPKRGGGLIDQPYIWMQEYAVVSQETTLWAAIAARAQPGGKNAA